MPSWFDAAISAAPILLLVILLTMRRGLPAQVVLPLCAALLYLIRLAWFRADPNITNAAVIEGLLTAWTPILIVFGAILLFNTLDYSGGMAIIRRWLDGITENRAAQLMIIGWSFSYLIEGASGFGTPAAIAAPILVGLGFDPLRVAIFTLIMNSVPISFGAVGTPIWFGLGELGLSTGMLHEIGFKSALLHGVASLFIAPVAMLMILPRSEVRRNIVFIYLSVLTAVIPSVIIAYFNHEFPSLAGGAIGLAAAIFLAKRHIGLSKERDIAHSGVTLKELVRASYPIWGTVLLLTVTRIPHLGLKALLNASSPALAIPLGTLGTFKISPALVLSLQNIFETGATWVHRVLYVPSIIPFFAVCALAPLVMSCPREVLARAWWQSLSRLRKPIIALSGTLVLVKLLMSGGDRSSAIIIGQTLANAAGEYWRLLAPLLGAVGAMFAGSNTVSNLTFAAIQNSAAINLGLEQSTILALQTVGGACGLMFSVSHVIAASAVLGILGEEGSILRKTIWPMLLYVVIVAIAGLFI